MFYTYSIKNIENGKFYIGSRTAKCMLNRKPEDDLGVKYFSSSKDKELRQAIKDGKVEYHILQEYDDPQVCWRAEQQLISIYWKFFGKDMSYNHAHGTTNGGYIWSTMGVSFSAQTRKKISNIHKGKPLSEEHKQKIGKSQKCRPKSEETKKKMSEAKKGKPQNKFYWQTPKGEIKEMDKSNAMRYHKDWILIGPIENK